MRIGKIIFIIYNTFLYIIILLRTMKRHTLIQIYKKILSEVINNLQLNKPEKRGRYNKFDNLTYLTRGTHGTLQVPLVEYYNTCFVLW